ncbi:uncharacterized protein LOC128182568 [Crassostrea angulata]|uniref:Uncharacterized protein n=1 Tax=Magallana gigas TaxID=29159 RepID=A0A8W8IGS6_MAGGI|nr:uncharacterized protein LOC105336866 [Crassostrea gigas]XP_052707243.1 uncharacterized protein LOC128182568 [Crassostrea angulata]
MRNYLLLFVSVYALFVLIENSVNADDSPCWRLNGRCQWTSEPCGRYNSAPLCGGPNNRQCCVRGADRLCEQKYWLGRCKYTSSYCRGGFDGANLCGGGNNRQCCKY